MTRGFVPGRGDDHRSATEMIFSPGGHLAVPVAELPVPDDRRSDVDQRLAVVAGRRARRVAAGFVDPALLLADQPVLHQRVGLPGRIAAE
ncbi:hypothetical protein [Actinoplanes sp. NPDC051411]|uniref:hypothetical protein n=1 Tax=Actinoplanes sp. NPDC051411 TaxID=3155522 RepID=UPI00344930F7